MNNSLRLTIRAIHVRGLNLQLARPVETASGVLSAAPLVLIDLVTDEGITGSSYIRCYTPLALQPLVQLVANCGALFTGQAAAPATIERSSSSTSEREATKLQQRSKQGDTYDQSGDLYALRNVHAHTARIKPLP